jgi:hypothetical protein
MGTGTEIRITADSAQASLESESQEDADAAGRSTIAVPLVMRRDASSIA